MIVVFEVYLVRGADPGALLTESIKRETNAQIMTLDEARKVGFAGLPDVEGEEVRLIAVAKKDANWIYRSMETSDLVKSFRMHDVG
jgi:hypothetical protein